MQLEGGERFIGSKLLKFMGKLKVIFSFSRNTDNVDTFAVQAV
jgi:hypothetical protein